MAAVMVDFSTVAAMAQVAAEEATAAATVAMAMAGEIAEGHGRNSMEGQRLQR